MSAKKRKGEGGAAEQPVRLCHHGIRAGLTALGQQPATKTSPVSRGLRFSQPVATASFQQLYSASKLRVPMEHRERSDFTRHDAPEHPFQCSRSAIPWFHNG